MSEICAFGEFEFDPRRRVLLRHGEWVSLSPQALEVLRLLVLNAGQLVSREEFSASIWPRTAVTPGSLTQNVYTLRRALAPNYIQTVARRGYRFTVPLKDGNQK